MTPDKAKRLLREATRGALAATRKGLKKGLAKVKQESDRLVPVDTGDLKDTGQILVDPMADLTVRGVVRYGSPAVPYAIFVHEIPPPPSKSPGGRSARHDPPTQWKFLQVAVEKLEDEVMSAVDAEIEKVL